MTFKAANGIGTDATQAFTLTVNQAPAITSAAIATFTVGTAGSFNITSTGFPINTLSESGVLPGGVTLTDHSDNTATLGGTPNPGSGGTYPLTLTAANTTLPDATQAFTLTVNEVPAFTSAASTTFTAGMLGSFNITTSGFPAAGITFTGSLPAGVTLSDNSDGTATLSGTPAAGTLGTYTLNLSADNSVGSPAAQTFTLTVNEAPAITSAATADFSVGMSGSFTITTTGLPLNALSQTGTLPGGVTFTDNGNNTATLAGTPDAGSGGSYALTLTAANTILPDATQAFTLVVHQAPFFTSPASGDFYVGMFNGLTINTSGFPYPAITTSSTLPAGLTLTDNHDGTATLGGTPDPGTGGDYTLDFAAANGTAPDAAQTFTLTIYESPSFISPSSDFTSVGTPTSIAIETYGYPLNAISMGGTLPTGMTFTDNGDNTATLGGTPAPGTGGQYALTFTALNTLGSPAVQYFTLTVFESPAFTNADHTTFIIGASSSFMFTTVGYVRPYYIALNSSVPPLPASLTFTLLQGDSAILTGTPLPGDEGVYTLSLESSNETLPNATQTFTLTIGTPPAITSAASTTFTVGSAGTFDVTTTGFPINAITRTGTLPASLSFTDNGDNTATLAGTPAGGDGGVYSLDLAAANGISPDAAQTFALTINEAPAFTSAASTTFTAGAAGSFTVTTSGYPDAGISTLSPLPGGVTLSDNGDGTATLAGTPDPASGGVYTLTMDATNGTAPDAAQTFTLTVNQAPAITSAASTTFTVGTAGSFTVTTTGYPAAGISTISTLPGGVTLTDNGDGTATLAGIPDPATGGVYTLILTAANGTAPDASQTFTLTVNQAPAITSAASTTFTVGTAGNFTVTTTGFPAPAITPSGSLPSGVTFTDNGDGTATLSGTPDPATGGVYTLALTASNKTSPDATQTFTLTVNQAPAITSAASTIFLVDNARTFTITTSGYPAPAITFSGSLPASVNLTDNGDGTATLDGTPVSGEGGIYTLTLTAANGTTPDATQTFTLTVNQLSSFTSANNTTFTVGAAGNFSVTTLGYPLNTMSQTGALPGGISFGDNHDNTATLGGIPDAGTGGVYPLTFTATNGISPLTRPEIRNLGITVQPLATLPGYSATQVFTLTINQAPTITSTDATTFTVGSAGTFIVTTTGYPTPNISTGSALPAGVTLTDNGDGTATLSGTPDPTTGGVYTLALAAANGTAPDAAQIFTLTVNEAPAITSAASTIFAVGAPGSFTVTTSGHPAPAINSSGALPTGVTFTDNGNGTATLGGTPTVSGVFTLNLTASNGVSPDATQTFTLTVNHAPLITSADATTFTRGSAGSFTVTTSGFPNPAITFTGALPNGVALTDNGDGTATLSGTPTASGVFPLNLTAANGVLPNAVQTFTLTVNEAPAITSAANTDFSVGVPASFDVTTTGLPLNTISQTGTLPAGITFTDHGDNTAALAGTPAAGSGGSYALTFSAANTVSPDASQSFTLVVHQAPLITSPASTDFYTGMGNSFTITTSGYPFPAITTSSALPSGITLTDNGDGTAALAGTPDAGTGGVYTLNFAAANGTAPDAAQTFTLTVFEAPQFTSPNSDFAQVGTPANLLITTTGYPSNTITFTGSLPAGMSFTDNGDNTATLSGTPLNGAGGQYTLVFTAHNGIGSDAIQNFDLTVFEAPEFTNANHTTFVVGAPSSFDFATDGYITTYFIDLVSSVPPLPTSLTFTPLQGNLATLSGTPLPGDEGVYLLSLESSNETLPNATQTFTLTIGTPPAITSAASTTFIVGSAGSFDVTSTGFPINAITQTGALPAGVTLTDNGDNTATLAGTPTIRGVFALTFTAANGILPDATQVFSLTVNQAPIFTSADNTTFATGSLGYFLISASGLPDAAITFSGSLPTGVTLTDNGKGTATLTGTPTESGVFTLSLAAANGVLPDAAQTFTLTVNEAPAITSAASTTFILGSVGTFTITTTGYPNPKITSTGALPAGVTFTDNGDGTATLGGTPAESGVFTLNLTAANGVTPDAAQTFTLTVNAAPAITSAASTIFTVGTAGTFTVTTTGYPTPVLTSTGTLPAGVTFVDNGDGTATLTGTPTESGVFTLSLTAANGVTPDAAQTFTLTVNEAPAITSAASATFTLGSAGTFTVTTTGYPTPDLTSTGALPASVTFIDNGDGTATLAGTPTESGVFTLNLAAANGVSPDASQTFTLTVNEAPAITSAASTTFEVGTAGTFTVTATGYPTPAITSTGALPAGVTFTDNGDGTATLGGTPTASGVFTLSLVAANGVTPDATQTFTLTVNEAPAITSAASTTFTLGSAGTFTITATGYPTPAITSTGTLPVGVAFTDNGDGTATLGGTPTASGVFTLSLVAANGVTPDAAQTFTLTVNAAPAITSAASTTFEMGTAGSFTVTATGYPTPTITSTGTLPVGVTFIDNGDGTATLAGTPTASGVFTLNLVAANGVTPDATQTFTLTANEAPAITSAASTTFTLGSAGTFTVTTTGYPTPAITSTGALPAGVTFIDNGDGSATLAGTPTENGVFTLSLTAANGVLPDATQTFTLTVNEAPAITSAASTTFTLGTAGTFTVTATGYPTPVLTSTGTLPAGVTFVDNGDGTATLSGTPAESGVFTLNLTAANGVTPDAAQTFTLTVNAAPAITSAASTIFTVGTAGTFTVTTTGYPTPVLTSTGTLPAGVTFVDNGDGTATLTGTPTESGVFTLSLAAANGVTPDATQTFTLTVNAAPVITSAASTTFTLGSAGTFTFTATGYPIPAITSMGTLPASVTFTDNGDGTATLGGTPTESGVFTLSLAAANGVTPDAAQTFTLTVNEAPAITSAASNTFEVGMAGTFTVTATGYPNPKITSTGALPAGVTFTDNGDGTATLGDTPTESGVFTLSLTAANGVLPDATQTFTLTVNEAPAITSAANTTFTVGTAGTFTVTTTGYPIPAITSTGTLPAGVTFTDNGDGTATLAGTPTASGMFTLNLTAANGITPDAAQTFTLMVNEAPAITSAASTTFEVGTARTFIVTTTGYPNPKITSSGALPAGVTFTDNGDSTATLGGTPTESGVFTLNLAAANGVSPDASQTFTLTVNEAPAITSGASTTFEVGTAGTFTVTTTGYPTPAITSTGALPAGVTFIDNGDGSATLAGTPTENGVFTLSLAAANGVTPDATQTFTLNVNQAPGITSAARTTFTLGSAGTFTVTTTGYPVPTITSTGALPAGVTFTDNGDGTATLGGTPTESGVFTLSLAAANGVSPDAAQTFTLTVTGQAPAFTSTDHASFTVGTAGSFSITTSGDPTPAITYTGSLPAGVSLVDNGDGTATLAGIPTAGGIFSLTLTAANGILPDATQVFTLTVGQAPAFISADNTAVEVGTFGSFTVITSGYPLNTITQTGALPSGMTFSDHSDNTAVLSGTPAAGTGGIHVLSLAAANGVLPDAAQTFTLTVNEAPAITSADHATFTAGTLGNFTITTSGYPAAGITFTGALPAGVTLADNGNGTATLSGTPAAGTSGEYTLNLAAVNGVSPNAAQAFTLTVTSAPQITSANAVTFVTGEAGNFTVTSTGSPLPTLSSSGTLPAGVTFTPHADGTATLAGTPTASGVFPLVFTASNGVPPDATQNFTLTVEDPAGVILINSNADTGDGVLAEGEHTAAAIKQLLVTFSKDMTVTSAQNTANYDLRAGSTAIAINSVTYDTATRIATLNINGGVALPDSAYTLTVTGTLSDLAGYPLGSDFVRNFVVDNTSPEVTFFMTADSRLITEGAVLSPSFAQLQVQFSEDVFNPTGSSDVDDVTNPRNYLLFQAGPNGTFDTISCNAGIQPDDVQISTGPVVYPYTDSAAFTALVTLNNGTPLPNGRYRLMVCGTTSIVDAADNKLANGQDEVTNFNIQRIEEAEELPTTGFVPAHVTVLPDQPAALAYSSLGNLWIEIPSLNVRAPITGVPFENDTWNVTWLYDQVGWLQGTAYPTWAGNTVLTGHAFTSDGAAGPFVALKYLKYDDTIILHASGTKYTYAIRTNFLTKPQSTSWITRHEKLDWVTLITCQQFNEKTQSFDYRRVVRAVLVNIETER